MPANLVTGQDAVDVAAYVASVAGRAEDGAPPEATGAEAIFTQRCGSCHTLAAANTAGTIGPSLDQLSPDAERVERAMREGPGQMPSFEGQLSDEDIEAVAKYVADN
ncbi:MAG: cytochrome c [Thermoleophilia bacterium]|nr:cytochrome c [Thermoleophilia bacterium]